MSLVNTHSMDYIATLIELLVKKGREPEMEFQFHGKTYVIVAYQDGIDFQECRSEGNPDPPPFIHWKAFGSCFEAGKSKELISIATGHISKRSIVWTLRYRSKDPMSRKSCFEN